VGSDGRRPMPAIRDELRKVLDTVSLAPIDRTIIEAWYGLRQFPAELTGTDNALNSTRAGRQRTGSLALTSRAVQMRRKRAMYRVAEALDPRPTSEDMSYGALSPAWLEPWCQPLSHFELECAFDVARDILAVGQVADPRSLTNQLHAQLDELHSRIDQGIDGVPERLARANAALAIGLWDWLGPDSRRRERESIFLEGLHVASARSAIPRPLVRTAPSEAAPLLGGSHDDYSLVAAIDAVTSQPVHPSVAWPILELCLSETSSRIQRPDPVVVHVLYRTCRYAAAFEDWRAVLLARQLVRDHPHDPLTLYACVDASVTAGAHQRFEIAHRALNAADHLVTST
jgi:hypothetical protein